MYPVLGGLLASIVSRERCARAFLFIAGLSSIHFEPPFASEITITSPPTISHLPQSLLGLQNSVPLSTVFISFSVTYVSFSNINFHDI